MPLQQIRMKERKTSANFIKEAFVMENSKGTLAPTDTQELADTICKVGVKRTKNADFFTPKYADLRKPNTSVSTKTAAITI